MKVKILELDGALLDWAVAQCEKLDGEIVAGLFHVDTDYDWYPYSPSTNWEYAGPIIEREKLTVGFDEVNGQWLCESMDYHPGAGPTPLLAAMRAYVVLRHYPSDREYVDEEFTIEVPEEIMQHFPPATPKAQC